MICCFEVHKLPVQKKKTQNAINLNHGEETNNINQRKRICTRNQPWFQCQDAFPLDHWYMCCDGEKTKEKDCMHIAEEQSLKICLFVLDITREPSALEFSISLLEGDIWCIQQAHQLSPHQVSNVLMERCSEIPFLFNGHKREEHLSPLHQTIEGLQS